MSKKTIITDVLRFSNFDPSQLDVSDINNLTQSIPTDGNVTSSIADTLAVKFLRGADRCSELLSILTWWSAKKEDEKRHVYSSKFFESTHKTAAARKAYAEASNEYLEACDAANRAKAMKQWLHNKHDSLVSAHYLMKQIGKADKRGEQTGGGRDHGWENQQDTSEWGEQSW